MVARTGKYAKHMETPIKAYELDDKDPITILRFLVLFKKACVPNNLSEAMALWIISNFLKDGPAYKLAARMTLCKDDGTTPGMPKTEKSRSLRV